MKKGDKVFVTDELLNYQCYNSDTGDPVSHPGYNGKNGIIMDLEVFGPDWAAVALDFEIPDPIQPENDLIALVVLPKKALKVI